MLDRLLELNPYQGLWDFLEPFFAPLLDRLPHHDLPEPIRMNAGLLVLLVFGLLLMFIGRGKRGQRGRKDADEDEKIEQRGTPWWRRLWLLIVPGKRDLMALPGMVIDRTSRPHTYWIGPTGYGKSSAVAVSRVNGQRPMLIICPDLSDPLRDAVRSVGGIIFNVAGDGPQGLVVFNLLVGTPRAVARRLTDAFRSGGVGAWKRTARRAVDQVLQQMDAAGEPRTLAGVARGLEKLGGSEMRQQAIAAWIERFADVAEDFGESIGAGGHDLATLLRQGKTVLWEIDSFTEPGMLEDLVSLGLVEAKRVADLVPGGFRLVLEEAGQLDDRIDLIMPFLRAGRRRRIPVDLMTQFGGDLSRAMGNNISTTVLFAQEDDDARRMAANRTGIDKSEFDPKKLGMYTAWVKHGDMLRKIKFPKPKDVPELQTKPGVEKSQPGVIEIAQRREPGPRAGTEEPGPKSRYVVDVVARADEPRWETVRRAGPLALGSGRKVVPTYVQVPGADGRLRRLEIWDRLEGTWTESSCHLWPKDAGRNKGYGKTSYLNRGGWETHFLFWAWRVIEDQGLGRRGDLEVFYARHPEVPRFEWQENEPELVTLVRLKDWMRAQDPTLSVDHACPGFPNSLCGNYRHLQLVTKTENSQLRHSRRRGDGRLAAEEAAGVR